VPEKDDAGSDAGQGGNDPAPGDEQPTEAAVLPAAPAAPEPENRRARRAAASSKNRGQRPERPRPGSIEGGLGLDASERVDDAFSRASDRTFRWIKQHFNVMQWLIVGGIATWIGMQIYTWRSDKTAVKVSALLADAIGADLGKTGSPDDEGKRDTRGNIDARRVFATEEARLAAARDGYQKVVAERPGTPAANLAKLGLAGVFYDQAKYDDARRLYEEVLGSELAKLDPESKGRSLEGIGLSLEAKGDRDGALKRFGELENAEISGFRELALYHEGRLLHEKGDDKGAVEKLKKVVEKLGTEKKTSPTDPPNYLAETARQLLQRIDPKAVPPPSSEEALQKALEAFQKKLPAGVTRMPMPLPPGAP
jgi:tetratricopeptide (TPR) repeat protein